MLKESAQLFNKVILHLLELLLLLYLFSDLLDRNNDVCIQRLLSLFFLLRLFLLY